MLKLGLFAGVAVAVTLLLNMARKTITTEQLLEMVKNAAANCRAFEGEDFYQKFQLVTELSKDWDINRKCEFVKSVISIFEGMEGWDFISADSWKNIFELTQDTAKTLDSLALVAKTFPEVPETQKILYILSEVKRIKQRQQNPIYNLNQTPSVVFNDPGLKLALINELMYRKKQLNPLFDLKDFAEEYAKYFIDYKRGASQEATQYLLNLDIPQYLLDQIDEFHLSSQAELYRVVALSYSRFGYKYHPGGFVPITAKAIDDLVFLPNLRCINLSGDEFVKVEDARLQRIYQVEKKEIHLSEAFVQALKERGIKVYQGENLLSL